MRSFRQWTPNCSCISCFAQLLHFWRPFSAQRSPSRLSRVCISWNMVEIQQRDASPLRQLQDAKMFATCQRGLLKEGIAQVGTVRANNRGQCVGITVHIEVLVS